MNISLVKTKKQNEVAAQQNRNAKIMELEKRSSEDYEKPEYNLFVWVDTHPENLQNNFLNKDWDINIKFGSFIMINICRKNL